jgi:hypothetical protein
MKKTWKKGLVAVSVLVVIGIAYYVFRVPDKELAPFLTGLRRAPQLILREGLPHQRFEPTQLKNELAGKQTIELNGFPFYAAQQEMSLGDAAQLRRVLSWPRDFSHPRPNSVKSCGGYHPDYLIEWSDDGENYQMQICLSCHEIKFYGPSGESHYDVSDRTVHLLRTILDRYRDQRPKFEMG